ncbi:UNVERIFIED_CONTAM: hypothetical protein PYX00_005253 [Menopon gallinae]|uniref:Multiple inositol polyphosphate phosphatase 1 n=1 Tax=Menopon gallinae TaxID=328185 RepID=A0AAW2HRH2_9NEOP
MVPQTLTLSDYKLLFGILYILCNISCCSFTSEDCFSEKEFFSDHLGSKTAYDFVANTEDSQIRFDGCEPKKIWTIVRHGSRYPSREIIVQMKNLDKLKAEIIKNHQNKRGDLCPSTLSKLDEWSFNVNVNDSKKLVHEGEDEMIELAERYQKRFPEILPENYQNLTYQFRYTATQRTEESKRYFTIGLFDRKVARHVWSPDPIDKDPLLRFYKRCSKWKREVKHNSKSAVEKEKFLATDNMKNVISTVSRRLGFYRNLTVVFTMYNACSFESAWSYYHKSPWCYVFSKEDLQVLEYVGDLEKYWQSGYGYEINYKQACPIVKDMFKHMTSEKEPRSTFYFTHSGTVLKVLAHLGLYRDRNPLKHDNLSMDRLWRTSRIDAFATNIAFVLFRCEDGEKVLTMHQEKPVVLPGCEKELCPLEVLQKEYHDSIYDCDFNGLCGEDRSRG